MSVRTKSIDRGLLACLRGAEARLRPALAAARGRQPLRERLIQSFRRFAPLAFVPASLPDHVRYYLPSTVRPNSKTEAVVRELCEGGVPRQAIWTRADDRTRSIGRVVRQLPFALMLVCNMRRRQRPLDNVQQQIVIGRELYRRLLRRHPKVVPVVISDVSPELHMLWSAAAVEGDRALWWQDDFHHCGPLTQSIGAAAVRNAGGYQAARRRSPGARIVRRPGTIVRNMRAIPEPFTAGLATNAFFTANDEQRALLLRLRNAIGASMLEVRLHPNSRLREADFPESWLTIAPRDEPLSSFAERIDLCIVGNSAVQLQLACLGVPVAHVSGLDPHGFDLYGYCRDGLIYGADNVTVPELEGYYSDPARQRLIADRVGWGDIAVPEGLGALAKAAVSLG